MDVSVIIVNYNTTLLTEQCIASVIAHTKSNRYEIIVVDNASADRSIEQVTEKFPGVQLLHNTANLGFGRANNRGLEIASGDFVFLLNSDTLLVSDAIGAFVHYMRQPGNSRVAVCGGELFTGTARKTASFGNFPGLLQNISSLGLFYLYPAYYRKHLDIGVANYDDKVKQVDFISGADMLIRASVLHETGRFDEDFFLYFEETELSYRIKKKGYTSVLLPSVKIIHYEGSSSAEAADQETGFNYNTYLFYVKSRQLFYRKTYGKLYATTALALHVLHLFIRSLARKDQGNLWRKLRILLQSQS